MGQKINPQGLRVGYIGEWKSTWFSTHDFSENLAEDAKVRAHINTKLAHAGLSDIVIRKNSNEATIDIHTARPGIVIGKSGSEVDALRQELHAITGKQVKVNILEVKRPELDAKLVAQSIGEQLENRVAFRRAMKRALTSAMRSGAKGVKVQVSGRLGGAEMARRQVYSDGSVPLHTLRADIDYGFHEAHTTAGRIGIKCWVNKGEIMPEGFPRADVAGELPSEQETRNARTKSSKPRRNEPKKEEPKAEVPKKEEPKAEVPKKEEPKVEEAVEAPEVVEEPVVEEVLEVAPEEPTEQPAEEKVEAKPPEAEEATVDKDQAEGDAGGEA